MSQTELGEAFGVSRWTIARMEEGGDIPPWVPLAMAELRRRHKRVKHASTNRREQRVECSPSKHQTSLPSDDNSRRARTDDEAI